MARIEVKQPLELVYTDLSGPISHCVSASSGVASIYGKGARKHVQTRRLRIGFRAEGAQDDWLNVGN